MFILGFTDEDVTGGWQHWRLATECGSALEAEGLPVSYGVSETAGEGRYLIEWQLQDDVAAIFDRHGVGWRRFLIAVSNLERGAGHPPLIPSTRAEREILAERTRAARKVAR
jgi:hypothetical protein